jgi:molybdopterin-containing oxidoreductase family membrane subunit
MGVALNRFVLTIQTLAVPTLAFDQFLSYWPSWQEFATFGAVIAFGVLVYSFSFRYLSLFPQEREIESLEQDRQIESLESARGLRSPRSY